jgi:hypothetical protein
VSTCTQPQCLRNAIPGITLSGRCFTYGPFLLHGSLYMPACSYSVFLQVAALVFLSSFLPPRPNMQRDSGEIRKKPKRSGTWQAFTLICHNHILLLHSIVHLPPSYQQCPLQATLPKHWSSCRLLHLLLFIPFYVLAQRAWFLR